MALVHFKLSDFAAGAEYFLCIELVDRLEVGAQPRILEHREPFALIVLAEEEGDQGAEAGSKDGPPDGMISPTVEPRALHCIRIVHVEVVAIPTSKAANV